MLGDVLSAMCLTGQERLVRRHLQRECYERPSHPIEPSSRLVAISPYKAELQNCNEANDQQGNYVESCCSRQKLYNTANHSVIQLQAQRRQLWVNTGALPQMEMDDEKV